MSAGTAAAIMVAGLVVGGGLVYLGNRVGGSLDRLGDSLTAFLPGWQEISSTLSNGPRRPWLVQLVDGRCVTAAAAAVQATPKLGWYATEMRLLHVMLTWPAPACWLLAHPPVLVRPAPPTCSEAAGSGMACSGNRCQEK